MLIKGGVMIYLLECVFNMEESVILVVGVKVREFRV